MLQVEEVVERVVKVGRWNVEVEEDDLVAEELLGVEKIVEVEDRVMKVKGKLWRSRKRLWGLRM